MCIPMFGALLTNPYGSYLLLSCKSLSLSDTTLSTSYSILLPFLFTPSSHLLYRGLWISCSWLLPMSWVFLSRPSQSKKCCVAGTGQTHLQKQTERGFFFFRERGASPLELLIALSWDGQNHNSSWLIWKVSFNMKKIHCII